ncbi:MAG: cation diffusion facilitator family transporter [Burkholderiales bacterium]
MREGTGTLRRMALLSIATSIATLALKFGAYFLTDSVSLLSDAYEAFINLAAGLVAFAALAVAARPSDDRHRYGHDKAEYFASGVEGVLIAAAAVAIVYSAVLRFIAPVPLERLGLGGLIALVAAALNYLTARVMLRAAARFDSITLEADALHLLTDVRTSIVIVAGLAVVAFVPAWAILDPVMAIGVALNIVWTGGQLMRRSVDGLLDASLPDDELRKLEQVITKAIGSHARMRDMRTRKSGRRRFVELKLLVPGATRVDIAHDLTVTVERAVAVAFPDIDVVVHVEPEESPPAAQIPS